MQKKFTTEALARETARRDHADEVVVIIASPEHGGHGGQTMFYLEDTDGVFIRNYERQLFSGKGREA